MDPRLTLEVFREQPPTGAVIASRKVRDDPIWGVGVWWSDRFGICSPVVAAIGGPLGYESDLPNPLAET